MCQAFDLAKKAPAGANPLSHRDSQYPLPLVTDASCRGLGGAVQQIVDGLPRLLAFFARRTSAAVHKYSPYDLELLGLYSSILHFRHLLEGRTFTILIDQKPLTSAFLKGKDPISSRQRNQLSFISKFCTDIMHVPGLDNVVADWLSRQYKVDQILADSLAMHAITHILSDIDLDHLAEDQLRDEECVAAPTAITNLQWQHYCFPGMRHEVLCDVSLQRPRIYVPVGWRKQIFDALHSLAHPSGKTTLEILSRDYVWHGMKKEVVNLAKTCVKCQQNKITRHTKPPT